MLSGKAYKRHKDAIGNQREFQVLCKLKRLIKDMSLVTEDGSCFLQVLSLLVNGKNNSHKNLHHEMDRGAKAPGVKRIRIYGLRHFHASMPVEMGVSPLEIADRLGNKKIETTLNTYSHLYPNKRTALADKLNEKYKEALCSWNMENEISYE